MEYIKEFYAVVTDCIKTDIGYSVCLDNTLFYAEGGGQPSDKGKINEIAVLDVRETHEGICHLMPEPFEKGQNVKCEIDFKRRFSFMQHHTAEHIISGLAVKKHGFKNVGFHIGSDCTTLDFDGELTTEQVDEIEFLANQAIWENVPVTERILKPDESASFNYRSKKEISGDIRIITVEGYDTCACCGSHVMFTGEIGAVKIIDAKRYKGGIRLSIVCGAKALEDYSVKHRLVRGLCAELSSKETGLAERIKTILDQTEKQSAEISRLRMNLFRQHIKTLSFSTSFTWVLWEDANPKDLPVMATELANMAGDGMVVVPRDSGGYLVAIASSSKQAKEIAAKICTAFSGKGGGSPALWQGSLEHLPFEKIDLNDF